jgi:hypothetical protein
MKNIHNISIREAFYAPVQIALGRSKHTRGCRTYSDKDHIESGIERVIRKVQSGRDWVQYVCMKKGINLSVGNFFQALRSKRRFRLMKEIADDVRLQCDENTPQKRDPLSQYQELDGFAVYASDGHTHAASTHERKRFGKVYPVSHIFSVNIRTHSLTHLDVSKPLKHKKKEHELATLKRLGGQALRMGEPKGRKVIHIYDPAIIDYRQWYNWKSSRGIYILTREKDNSALMIIGIREWDNTKSYNNGVLADEYVGPSNGVQMRRITYKDPVTGKIYRFITNEFTIPPGMLAFLYKLRWDIEKIFDVVKNKFGENKAWAQSDAAKTQQAAFITLAHNLTLMLERKLEEEEGIVDAKVKNKRKKNLEEREKSACMARRKFNSLVKNCQRATQRSLQFIRWLRYCLEAELLWRDAITTAKPLMERYLY